MKTKYLTTFLFVIGILSCCISIGAVESPADMGTVDYRDFEYVEFISDEQVNLSLVTSDIDDGLVMSFISYYPSENTTKYKFTSIELVVEYGFTPKVDSYYYQDENTGQIYVINVDHSDVEIPPSIYEELYQNLSSSFENLTEDFEMLTSNYSSLSENYTNIENILTSYTNVTGVTLSDVVSNLLNDYNDLNDSIMDTKNQFWNIWNQFNNSKSNYENLDDEYNDLFQNFTCLNESYNSTMSSLLNISSNFSTYKAFVERISNPYEKEGVYFQGTYYRPLGYYQSQMHDLKETIDENNATGPVFILLAIFITTIICYLIARRYIVNIHSLVEPDNSYSEKTHKFDKYILFNKLKDSFSIKKKTQPVTKTIPSKPETLVKTNDKNDGSDGFEEKLVEFQVVTDKKIDALRQDFKQDMTKLHNSIDQLLKQNGTPIGDGSTS